MVATVVGESHPGAQRKLVQFGQRLFVLHGALMFERIFVRGALVVTGAKLIRNKVVISFWHIIEKL